MLAAGDAAPPTTQTDGCMPQTVLCHTDSYYRGHHAAPRQAAGTAGGGAARLEGKEEEGVCTYAAYSAYRDSLLRNNVLLLHAHLAPSGGREAGRPQEGPSPRQARGPAKAAPHPKGKKTGQTVLFSVFPPKKYLLKNTKWYKKPLVLAEEMRYGLLIKYT
ncbi:hypothetical protein STCU_10440 [Strigomonas culicis]|uniref:Uncharacterized protein n=1 Tax=Strigomonas culicis TaxID=28005 RepID=S9TMY9_9TRYP|nr:hypothetical protein STCU_10440 [Strigomonas culicis]|eukprot:EPY17748.1 hypothetical protein STCU_10440 [Strigomonas culicis]